MMLILIFDIEVTSSDANKFRNSIKKNGFVMLQKSVYVRYCFYDNASKKYIKRIELTVKSLDLKGDIRIFTIPDKTYFKYTHVLGKQSDLEPKEDDDPIIVEI